MTQNNSNPAQSAFETAKHYFISADKPVPDFFAGAVLGNGGMGAVVTTRPDSIAIRLGHNNVWDVRINPCDDYKFGDFKTVYAMVKEGTGPGTRLAALQDKFNRTLGNSPYPRPHPCGSVILGFDPRRVELTGHELDISDGLCRVWLIVDGQKEQTEIFMDQSHDRLWIRHRNAKGQDRPCPFNRIRLLPDPNGLPKPSEGSGNDIIAQINSQTDAGDVSIDPNAEVLECPDDTISFRFRLPDSPADNPPASEFDHAFRVTARISGKLTKGRRANWFGGYDEFGPLEHAITSEDGFICCVQLDEGHDRDVDHNPAKLAKPDSAAFTAAETASREIWHAYWGRSAVYLDDKTLERTWYQNTYFLHCALRPGNDCPGLFGPWSYRDIGSAWHGDYHMNYNTQQLFWGLFSSNRSELHLPYVDLLTDTLIPLAKIMAEDYYEMSGLCFPHAAYNIDRPINGCGVPPWGWEICETPMTVQSLWWHYLYTQDLDFLRGKAFGPMREAMRFLCDFIGRPEVRGDVWGDDKWHVGPSVPPEIYGVTQDSRFNFDGTADLSLIRFLGDAYLRAAALLGDNDPLQSRVAEMLEHLPDYPMAETPDGPVIVSVPTENPELVMNEPVPMFTVFPAEQFGLHSEPETLEMLRRSFRNMSLEGGNELVFKNLQAARLGILDLERFKRQINYCLLPNGTCADMVLMVNGRYNDATEYDFMAPIGIWTENFALPGVINECLMQSYNGTIRLFPNWTTCASFADLRAVGGVLVSAGYDGKMTTHIRLNCTHDYSVSIIIPWEQGARVTQNGKTFTLNAGEQVIPACAGDIIEMHRAAG